MDANPADSSNISIFIFKGHRKSSRKKSLGRGFKQQQLPAWQPIVTARIVLPLLYFVGVMFVAIGTIVLYSSGKVREIVVDYSDCQPVGYSQYSTCALYLLRSKDVVNNVCYCSIQFYVSEKPMVGQVYMYYRLTNFYQNERRYANSYDRKQLQGYPRTYGELSSCEEPFVGDSKTRVPYLPCGAVANSLFNDTLSLAYSAENGVVIPLKLKKDGLAWPTDLTYVFGNPKNKASYPHTLPPPYWNKSVFDLDQRGMLNEDLIVWMKISAFPSFRKLYRLIDHDASDRRFKSGLLVGRYHLNVTFAYPVSMFDGRKAMVLLTTSWLGGKAHFLGYCYLIVGIIVIINGIMFTIMHLDYKKRVATLLTPKVLNDMTPYY